MANNDRWRDDDRERNRYRDDDRRWGDSQGYGRGSGYARDYGRDNRERSGRGMEGTREIYGGGYGGDDRGAGMAGRE